MTDMYQLLLTNMFIPDNSSKDAISVADIERQILKIRGHDVLTSQQVAQLYKIEVRPLLGRPSPRYPVCIHGRWSDLSKVPDPIQKARF